MGYSTKNHLKSAKDEAARNMWACIVFAAMFGIPSAGLFAIGGVSFYSVGLTCFTLMFLFAAFVEFRVTKNFA